MHYFYREMDFRETEKPTLVITLYILPTGVGNGNGGELCLCE